MTIHVQNLTQLVRCYEDDCSYEDRSPYVATATLVYENEHTVHVVGLTGQFNRKFYIQLWEYFNSNNITCIKIERKGVLITKEVPVLTPLPEDNTSMLGDFT